MKKVLFLQIKGKSFGGIWQVNKTLCDELNKIGYDAHVCAIRDNHPGNYEKTNFKQDVINSKEVWEKLQRRDVLNALKKGIKPFVKTFVLYLNESYKLQCDYRKMKKYIKNENPDYIIASHYQTLPGIPKEYLKKTVHVQHSTFDFVKKDRKNIKILKKYNNKIHALIWLCKSTCDSAENFGFDKNKYIYNPVRISCDETPNVVNNKRLVALTRISPEKRINLMIKIVNDVFNDSKFSDWSFHIYSNGELDKESKKIVNKSNQIFYEGIATNPKEVLLKSSCSLNTSVVEGVPLSIIESFACGIPALIFNYGESANELVTDGKNGFVVEQDDIEGYKQKLAEMISNPVLLAKMSRCAKESSERFEIDNVIKKWETLFDEIDKQ